jgi:O-antigen/teichoic acid export membrane protein
LVISRRQIVYFPLLVTASALQFFKGFVYAQLLPVEAFGSFNQAILFVTTFASFAGCGFPLLAAKVLPQYYLREDTTQADDLLGSAIGIGLAALLASLAVVAFAAALGALSSLTWWSAVLFYGFFQYVFTIKLSDIRSELRFVDFALLSACRAILFLAGGALTAWLTRNVVITLLYELVITAILSWPIAAKGRSRKIYRKVRHLIAHHEWLAANMGAALKLLWLTGTLTIAAALDKWAGVLMLNDAEYGVYALGIVILTVFEAAQFFVNVAAYPIMGRMVGAGNYEASFRFAKRATLIVAVLSVALYLPALYAVDWLIPRFLVKYTASIGVIHVLIIAGCFRLADFYGSLAILCNREMTLARVYLTILLVAALLVFVLHRWLDVEFSPARIAFIAVGVGGALLTTNFFVARDSYHHLTRRPQVSAVP